MDRRLFAHIQARASVTEAGVLCSVPDASRALDEAARVLRPNGELRFYEHVVARNRRLARMQRLFDATFWPRLFGGCHTSRDTSRHSSPPGSPRDARALVVSHDPPRNARRPPHPRARAPGSGSARHLVRIAERFASFHKKARCLKGARVG
jgi:hypothetical protein